MTYTVGEAAKILGVPASTLRYYEAEGLLPELARTESGRREFSDRDIEGCRVIECLKASGLSIKEIRNFMDMVQKGDSTLAQRLDLFEARRQAVEHELERLKETLAVLDFKRWYYESALEAGTEEAVKHLSLSEIPARHRAARAKLMGDKR